MLRAAEQEGHAILWMLLTHARADHMSGSPRVEAKSGAKVEIGEP